MGCVWWNFLSLGNVLAKRVCSFSNCNECCSYRSKCLTSKPCWDLLSVSPSLAVSASSSVVPFTPLPLVLRRQKLELSSSFPTRTFYNDDPAVSTPILPLLPHPSCPSSVSRLRFCPFQPEQESCTVDSTPPPRSPFFTSPFNEGLLFSISDGECLHISSRASLVHISSSGTRPSLPPLFERVDSPQCSSCSQHTAKADFSKVSNNAQAKWQVTFFLPCLTSSLN